MVLKRRKKQNIPFPLCSFDILEFGTDWVLFSTNGGGTMVHVASCSSRMILSFFCMSFHIFAINIRISYLRDRYVPVRSRDGRLCFNFAALSFREMKRSDVECGWNGHQWMCEENGSELSGHSSDTALFVFYSNAFCCFSTSIKFVNYQVKAFPTAQVENLTKMSGRNLEECNQECSQDENCAGLSSKNAHRYTQQENSVMRLAIAISKIHQTVETVITSSVSETCLPIQDT